jgi:hypothetical protein
MYVYVCVRMYVYACVCVCLCVYVCVRVCVYECAHVLDWIHSLCAVKANTFRFPFYQASLLVQRHLGRGAPWAFWRCVCVCVCVRMYFQGKRHL